MINGTAVYFEVFVWFFTIGYVSWSFQTIIKLHAGTPDIFCYALQHKILKTVKLREANAVIIAQL
jgi:hypothetical protein